MEKPVLLCEPGIERHLDLHHGLLDLGEFGAEHSHRALARKTLANARPKISCIRDVHAVPFHWDKVACRDRSRKRWSRGCSSS